MAQRRGIYMRGPLGKLLAWRYMTVCLLFVTCLLTTGIGYELLQRSGNWPPGLLSPHPTVAITGPGITQQIEGYVLGAVLRPAVYRLDRGARVRDLVLDAGGLLDTADITRVDLAALSRLEAGYTNLCRSAVRTGYVGHAYGCARSR